jgi:hypothetical protein
MTMRERHLADAMDVPNNVEDFIGGAEKRAKKHSKKASSDDTVTSMRLKKNTHRRLKRASIDLEQKIGDIVDQAVNDYLDGLEKNKKSSVLNDDDGL